MRLKILACKVLYRELSYLSALCPNLLDVTYMRQGLHNTPESLRSELQKEIDAIDLDQDIHTGTEDSCGPIDAILLAYGLCSNGVCGLSSKKYPLVVPALTTVTHCFLAQKSDTGNTLIPITESIGIRLAGWKMPPCPPRP